ncbi:uncharacterized protein LOC132348055 [Balaenoptera ricei]|uniref:uncharacterized protein LOC132348055 n=1 Tax=Balaenoptera ricei TaxID=2746895 RepID=UPI0028BDD074|nr:uncharacterized protein LOC132348055 [Balaenoptera ricei]
MPNAYTVTQRLSAKPAAKVGTKPKKAAGKNKSSDKKRCKQKGKGEQRENRLKRLTKRLKKVCLQKMEKLKTRTAQPLLAQEREKPGLINAQRVAVETQQQSDLHTAACLEDTTTARLPHAQGPRDPAAFINITKLQKAQLWSLVTCLGLFPSSGTSVTECKEKGRLRRQSGISSNPITQGYVSSTRDARTHGRLFCRHEELQFIPIKALSTQRPPDGADLVPPGRSQAWARAVCPGGRAQGSGVLGDRGSLS